MLALYGSTVPRLYMLALGLAGLCAYFQSVSCFLSSSLSLCESMIRLCYECLWVRVTVDFGLAYHTGHQISGRGYI